MDIGYLQEKVNWVWKQTLGIHRIAPETRIASSLSPIEIFVSLYYGKILHFDPTRPLAHERDRCVISKGHGSICMYPILADLGFFPKEELNKVCKAGGILGGIPDPVIPGYETVNGSLGHGLGVSAGMALGLKTKRTDQQVFVICGDGELHEGACWEAVMFASHHRLDNLNLIVDNNSISMLDFTDEIVSHRNLSNRMSCFGWDAYDVDGHDIKNVYEKLNKMKNVQLGKPKVLIAKTLKGKGVPGLENQPLAHIINPKVETIDKLVEGLK